MSIPIIESVAAMQQFSLARRAEGKRLGFVPTMGYLHEGHTSLMHMLRPQCDILVASIFVNPMQFGPKEDFSHYPRDMEHDRQLCEDAGCDVIIHPMPQEIYPTGFHTHVAVEYLTETLCGPWRPGHFHGVTTVVAKLFNIVMPHVAAFGQKDAQQATIIKQMVRDLNFPIEIVIGPTIREADGLAKSSRNVYLSPEERREAIALFRALSLGKAMIEKGERDPAIVIAAMRRLIEQEVRAPEIQYIEIVNMRDLHPVQKIEGEVLMALAVRIGKTRLIDNFMLTV